MQASFVCSEVYYVYVYLLHPILIASAGFRMVYCKKGVDIMKKLPLGIQTFRKIVEGNNVYADKTRYIYNLINNGNCYFLSRPRRFGKSLLLDTMAVQLPSQQPFF